MDLLSSHFGWMGHIPLFLDGFSLALEQIFTNGFLGGREDWRQRCHGFMPPPPSHIFHHLFRRPIFLHSFKNLSVANSPTHFLPSFLFLIIKRAKLAQNPENYSGKFQLVRGSKYSAQIPIINLLTNKLDIYFFIPLL